MISTPAGGLTSSATPAPEGKPSVLNHLLQTCIDGQDGYLLASDAVQDSELKTILSSYAAQRVRFAGELKVLLGSIDEAPEEEATLAGELHHGWINLKALIQNDDELAILLECVRGEATAVKRYCEAMSGHDVPESAQPIIRRQAREIGDAHDRMESLCQRTK